MATDIASKEPTQIRAATPAQGLMRETVSTQEMNINDTLKHP